MLKHKRSRRDDELKGYLRRSFFFLLLIAFAFEFLSADKSGSKLQVSSIGILEVQKYKKTILNIPSPLK